jgi:hypothetical protein
MRSSSMTNGRDMGGARHPPQTFDKELRGNPTPRRT